ncbi:MAG: protein phosphatase 2C domain-containing protein, partial [Oscillospiraceae bacterium]|nr:protein phosphatase 2C domain-containing protein [Oscillospiraceae bacterium]
YALAEIIKESQENNQRLDSYDTTLSLVIYNGAKICYGHSGDGGIIGLTEYGSYVSITKPQNDPADGISVIPLRAGPSAWEFGFFDEELVSVLLVTDGVLSALKPYLLKNHDPEFHVPTLSFLMHPAWFSRHKDHYNEITGHYLNCRLDRKVFYECLGDVYSAAVDDTPENIRNAISVIANYGFSFSLINDITDDKTALAIVNPDKPIQDKKPLAYYAEVDWNAQNEAYRRKAYPHLYEKKAPAPPATPVVVPQPPPTGKPTVPASTGSGQPPLQMHFPPPPSFPGFPPPQGSQRTQLQPPNPGVSSAGIPKQQPQVQQPQTNTGTPPVQQAAPPPNPPTETPTETRKGFLKGSKKGRWKIFLLLIGGGLILLFIIVAAASKGRSDPDQATSYSAQTRTTTSTSLATDPDVPSNANNGMENNPWAPYGETVPTTKESSSRSVRTIADEALDEVPLDNEAGLTDVGSASQPSTITAVITAPNDD